ncbi:hypothetical protein QBC47DRAFT_336606 [Echria macrotheca]|uniref:Modin n=1 Tax=Echria macrotheca TaxID=438768 RepID=A0AAJ0BLD7_9PEZI|nr:hypothetical protein QBC47DRAFT_336606 [Echria macrotheca]
MADVNGNSTATDTGDGGGGGGDDHVELFLAIAALVISVAAFFVSILQALQQYYSSARGYSSCGPAVIGKWARSRRRLLRLHEFRFEVQFEVPVMFAARPDNTRGPMGPTEKQEIIFLDGSQRSYEKSWTQNREEHDQAQKQQSQGARVHTADNEVATWLGLLMAIQRMEEESRDWQGRALLSHGISSQQPVDAASWRWPPQPYGGHALTVCIQKKIKSWDTIPDNVTKPYATTTIAHLVQFTAMLGIYWKVFDRGEDRYLAQGNGFTLSGSNVDGLGLTFTFQKKGPTWFEANRVVPHYDVKELCFGLCPTTFRLPDEKQYADEAKGIGSLQLGTMDEIAETLVVLGCNTHTVRYFREQDTGARFSHLFPIAFELVGMVGAVFQVKGTVFRTVPNPTLFRWDPKSFDLEDLLFEYNEALSTSGAATQQGQNIKRLLTKVLAEFKNWHETKALPESLQGTSTPSPKSTEKLATGSARDVESQEAGQVTRRRVPFLKQMSLRSVKAIPAAKPAPPIPPSAVYSPGVFEALHAAIDGCDAYLKPQENRSPNDTLLRLVLRAHLHSILHALNKKSEEAVVGDESGFKIIKGPPTIQDIDATTDRKHALFMEMYFETIQGNVVKGVCGRVRRVNGEAADTVELKEQVGDIWRTLIFRMLCWLLLHHFHEKDVQVAKSDEYESRMPVYIL